MPAAMSAVAGEAGIADLRARVEAQSWYHILDLPGGITTPGWFDLRPSRDIVPMPASLEGKRCLDVGTWDGFWAFEMERRGASEVIALDIDDPAGWDWPPQSLFGAAGAGRLQFLQEFKSDAAGFHLAHQALGSKVERRNLSIYDATPELLGGKFDFVFLGSLLLHLRDPVRALDRLRALCSGEAVIADTIDAVQTWFNPRTPLARLEGLDESWWWMPNRKGFHRMVESAGFNITQTTGMYFVPTGPAHPMPPLRTMWKSVQSAKKRQSAVIRLKGLPHTAVRAVPLG